MEYWYVFWLDDRGIRKLDGPFKDEGDATTASIAAEFQWPGATPFVRGYFTRDRGEALQMFLVELYGGKGG